MLGLAGEGAVVAFWGVAHTWLRGEPVSVAISGNESIPAVMQQFMADCGGGHRGSCHKFLLATRRTMVLSIDAV